MPIYYVDGSSKNGVTSWAYIVVINDKVVYSDSGKCGIGEEHLNVTGECFAVLQALRYAVLNKDFRPIIAYDFIGLEKWVTGEWKTKTTVTRNYKRAVDTFPGKITWLKIKSHSGDQFNELVDRIAKNELSRK